ncbi:hypothetical protein CMV_026199, partial [Castanea mollissima]
SGQFLVGLIGFSCLEKYLESLRLIQNGAKWRVGDGSIVQIYRWLPREGEGRVASPPSLLPEDCTVLSLIDEDSKWWNMELIDNLFPPDEAQKNIIHSS